MVFFHYWSLFSSITYCLFFLVQYKWPLIKKRYTFRKVSKIPSKRGVIICAAGRILVWHLLFLQCGFCSCFPPFQQTACRSRPMCPLTTPFCPLRQAAVLRLQSVEAAPLICLFTKSTWTLGLKTDFVKVSPIRWNMHYVMCVECNEF